MSFKILILLAAFMNYMPYVLNSYAWFFVFFSLTPLLYGVMKYPASFQVGLAWGFCMGCLHCSVPLVSACCSFFGMGVVTQLLFLVCVALYVGVHAGVLFFCAERISCYLRSYINSSKYLILRSVLFTAAISFFSIWFSDYFSVICGRCEGFIFAHALIPFGRHIAWIQCLVSWFNLQGTIMLLVLLQAACVVAWVVPKKSSYLFLGVCVTLWVGGFALQHDDYFLPPWHARVAYIPHMPLLGDAVTQALHATHKDIVFMPESSLFTCTAKLLPDLELFPAALHVVAGVCCEGPQGISNALLYFYDNEIKYRYDKQFLALFTETMPQLCGMNCFSCAPEKMYVKGTAGRTPLTIDGTITLMPYICSELFYRQAADDECSDVPIIALCGNVWAQGSYLQEVFLLGIALRALQWQRDVVYVSSSHGAFVSKWGNVCEIAPYKRELC